MSQGTSSSCLTCGGFIPEIGIGYSYGGKICFCPIDPNFIRYQRRVDEQPQGISSQLGILATNQTSTIDQELIKYLENRITELEIALKEFDNNDNWLIESSYRDRASKTGTGDWVYIGKYDPRVFATHAIMGTPLKNTNKNDRRQLSPFYEPGQPPNWAIKEKINDYEKVLMKLADYKGGDNAIKEAVDVLTKYGFYET